MQESFPESHRLVKKKVCTKTLVRITIAIVSGMIILYIPGTIRFAFWALGAGKIPQDKTVLGYTMAACVIPYLPGDFLKILVIIPVSLKIRPVIAQYLYAEVRENDE